jgi:hypothetical protein
MAVSTTPAVHVAVGDDPGYLSIRGLAAYSSLSVRTLRTYLGHRLRPLPHYRVGASDIDRLVSETLKGL